MHKNQSIGISLTLCCLFFLSHSSKSQSFNTSDKPESKLLLKSGFEEGVFISDDMIRITGSDVPGYSWDNFPDWIASSRFVYIVGQGKKLTDHMESAIEIASGPGGNKTRVLRMTNIADDPDHPSTSRNEYSFFGKQAPEDYKEGYVRYWMKLQDNLHDIIPLEESSPFYMIMEWKEPNSKIIKTAEECRACCNAGAGGSNNYRININIHKQAGSKDFYWLIRGEHPQPCRVEEWRHLYEDFKVKAGEWFLVEAYMKKHPTQGRVYFAINGQVILDTRETTPKGFTGRTQHAENPMVLAFWSPLKNYHGMEWNKFGPVSQWYDDFEMWSSFPPGHPAGRLSGQGKIIFHETFDYPDNTMPAHWWSEGVPASIRDGRMFVDADTTAPRVSTIWLDKEFSGNLSIEFDVHIVSSTNLDNNLNFFLFYSHPDGGALKDTREERADGNYNRYHKLNGYIFTHLANGTEVPARFRFRYNPGFQLMEELYAYECKRETTYHIRIVRKGNRFQYWADGKLIIDREVDDKLIHNNGLIGFRTFRTSLWWDNLVVRQMD